MSQGMRRYRLDDACTFTRTFQAARQNGIVEMMSTFYPVTWIDRTTRRRKYVLPAEFAGSGRVFTCQGVRQPGRAESSKQINTMEDPCTFDLTLQRLNQCSWQHGPSILAAFTVTHGDLVTREVNILDPQAQALHQAQTSAVEHACQQPRPTIHLRQQPLDLVARKYRRNALRPLGPYHIFHPRKIGFQHHPIQEQQCRQRLILRAGRHMLLHRQSRQELLDLRRSHIARMTLAVRQNESPDPANIDRLRPQAVMHHPQMPPDLIQQPRCGDPFPITRTTRVLRPIRHINPQQWICNTVSQRRNRDRHRTAP